MREAKGCQRLHRLGFVQRSQAQLVESQPCRQQTNGEVGDPGGGQEPKKGSHASGNVPERGSDGEIFAEHIVSGPGHDGCAEEWG